MNHRLSALGFLVLAGLVACTDANEESEQSVAASTGSPSFARNLVKVGSFPAGTFDGIDSVLLGENMFNKRYFPIPFTNTDYLEPQLIQFVDFERGALVPSQTVLPRGPEDDWTWRWSADESWVVLFKQDENRRPYVVRTTEDSRNAIAVPEYDGQGRRLYAYGWAGNDTLLVARGFRAIVGLDPVTFQERWAVEVSYSTWSEVKVATTPDQAHVVVATKNTATLVTLGAGTPTYKNIAEWGRAPSRRCGPDAVVIEDPGYHDKLEAIPSPTSKSFLLRRSGRDDAGHYDAVWTLSVEGTLSLRESCARFVTRFTSDGRFAYDVHPGGGVAPRIVVHPEDVSASRDIMASVPSVYPYPLRDLWLRLSDDGEWVDAVTQDGRLVLASVPAKTAGPTRFTVPEAVGSNEQVDSIAVSADRKRSVVATYTIHGRHTTRIDQFDLVTNRKTSIVPTYDSGYIQTTLLASDAPTNQTLFIQGYLPHPTGSGYAGAAFNKLVTLDGRVIKEWSGDLEGGVVGWGKGVLYYSTKAGNGQQLRGVSADGLTDVPIGPVHHDSIVKRTAPAGYSDTAVPIKQVLFQSGSDIYLFTPER